MPIDPKKVCDCLRCGFAWVKRVEGQPEQCPKCKSPYWYVAKGRVKMGRPPKKKAAKKRPAK